MKPFDHEHGDKVNSMFRQEHRREDPLGGKGCPNLDPKRVLACPDKRLHLQVLFQRLEEQLDLPAVLVDRGDRRRSEAEMVREKHDVLILLLVPDDDSPQLVRIFCRRCVPEQENALVGDDVSFLGNFRRDVDDVADVLLHSRDEEDSLLRPGVKAFEIKIPPVHRHDRPRLQLDVLRSAIVMDLRLGDTDERRHVVVVVEKHVNLDSALL